MSLNSIYDRRRTVFGNQRGQGLIEYLIVVALIAVSAIGVMRVVGKNLNAKLADVNDALRGEKTVHATEEVKESLLKKRDLGNFVNGVGGTENGN